MRYLVLVLITSYTLSTNAQKLPQIQDVSVRAPQNVKMDGKMNEWPAPFYNPQKTDGYLQAYNTTNRIYYTIANDDDNLYIVMRGLGTRVTRKSLSGSFTITLSHATDKKSRAKAADNVVINFPMPIDDKSISKILSQFSANVDFYNEDEVYPTGYPYIKQLDSIQAITNALLTPFIQEIKVKGIKEIPDTLLSVYNDTGIKAAMQFAWRQPVYEIAVPLKYLKLDVNNPLKFSYNIKLNLRAADPNRPGTNEDTSKMMDGMDYVSMDPGSLFMMSVTDFWGEYTLVKK